MCYRSSYTKYCVCRDIAIIWNTNINNNKNHIGSKPLHANISILVSGLASFDSISDMLSLLSLSLPAQAVLYNIIFAASVYRNHHFIYTYTIYIYIYIVYNIYVCTYKKTQQ